ncbi:MAG: 7,8-didemethyl-8-hydroxy-5-deazariboflavin synthase CofG [Novosphingobium sp.]
MADLLARSERLTVGSFGSVVTYSRKVFIPLTMLCRDVCHYCTFARAPREVRSAYLGRDEVLAIARAGVEAGCREALFTLGDRPEARYAAARDALASMGYDSTLAYLGAMARAVLDETGLLPHLNAGWMDDADYAALRPVAASMGLMLETASDRLSEKGGPHYGSPDKLPERRLEAMEAAGRAKVPFTTGLLIGIGETREERIEALLAIRESHARHDHIQEVIIQNFRAKPGTRMAGHAEPPLEEHLWTIAAARLILGPDMVLQAPPNLPPRRLGRISICSNGRPRRRAACCVSGLRLARPMRGDPRNGWNRLWPKSSAARSTRGDCRSSMAGIPVRPSRCRPNVAPA